MAATSPALQRFIDDELARVPLLVDEVLQQLVDTPLRLPNGTTEQDRPVYAQARQAAIRDRAAVVRQFSQTLREQITSAVDRQAAAVGGGSASRAGPLNLSLVDEQEIEMDVELQRCIVFIRSAAEYELRELGSFTSALVGDLDVAHDTNPLRPEAYARALMAAASVLPVPRPQQLAFVRLAAAALAEALRKSFAAACGRLEDEGVTPAAYRTIILPGSPGLLKGAKAAPANLHELRDSMPVPLDETPAAPPQPSAAPRVASPDSSRVDRQVIELLTRLFDTLLADRSLPRDVQLLLSRLQAPAVRVALRDPAMLDGYTHPVWEFMDRLAFEVAQRRSEPAALEHFMRYAEDLIDRIVAEPVQDTRLYRWGTERLGDYVEHMLGQHRQAAQEQIDRLRSLALSGAAPATAGPAPSQPAALDVSTLDTVPAELIDLPGASGQVARRIPPMPALQPGEWLHLFLQGEWRELQLLWTDGRGEAWLFRQPAGRTWALRRAALERLNEAGLAESMDPPSLVQHAAQAVLRQVAPPPGH